MLLDQIQGQAAALAILRNALANDRVAHAYVFTGPDGIGKRCTAIALAHALLCQEAPQHGCGSCPACASLQAGSHPDYHFTAPPPGKQSMGIDQIRAMQRFLALRPVRGGKKICILNAAHTLTAQAQSALLKVLEEPPRRGDCPAACRERGNAFAAPVVALPTRALCALAGPGRCTHPEAGGRSGG